MNFVCPTVACVGYGRFLKYSQCQRALSHCPYTATAQALYVRYYNALCTIAMLSVRL